MSRVRFLIVIRSLLDAYFIESFSMFMFIVTLPFYESFSMFMFIVQTLDCHFRSLEQKTAVGALCRWVTDARTQERKPDAELMQGI